MSRASAWAPVLVALLLVVPAIRAGQSTTAASVTSPDPVLPGSRFRVPLTIEYHYSGSGNTGGSVEAKLSSTVSGPLRVRHPSSVTVPVDDSKKQGSTQVDLRVRVEEGAEAFTQNEVEVTVRVPDDGGVEGSRDDALLVVVPQFVPGINVTVPAREVTIGAAIERVPVTIQNLANGAIEAQIEVASAPEGVQVSPPAPQRIPYRPDDPATASSDLLVVHTSDAAVSGPVELRARYWPVRQTSDVFRSDSLSLTVHASGSSGWVPIAAVGAIAAVVAGAVWWFKFR